MDAKTDSLSEDVVPKLCPRLSQHIAGMDLGAMSRIAASRLQQTALSNIGLIELVSGHVFAERYDHLYTTMFHGGERERSDLIVTRLHEDFAGHRQGLCPYRVIGLRDPAGDTIAGAQFSVLTLSDGDYVVPYLQYIYVRPENRRQDLSELLHTLVLAVSTADAARGDGTKSASVPFTLFETEPAGYGADNIAQAKAKERTQIHSQSGSLALMLKRKADGAMLSSHVQPGLEPGDAPLTLIWAIRPNPAATAIFDAQRMGPAVLAACYRSYRDEGFPIEQVNLAESMAFARCRDNDFCLMALADVTKSMYVDIDGLRTAGI